MQSKENIRIVLAQPIPKKPQIPGLNLLLLKSEKPKRFASELFRLVQTGMSSELVGFLELNCNLTSELELPKKMRQALNHALRIAVSVRQPSYLNLLVSHGAQLLAGGLATGDTAMHYAVRRGDLDCIIELLNIANSQDHDYVWEQFLKPNTDKIRPLDCLKELPSETVLKLIGVIFRHPTVKTAITQDREKTREIIRTVKELLLEIQEQIQLDNNCFLA